MTTNRVITFSTSMNEITARFAPMNSEQLKKALADAVGIGETWAELAAEYDEDPASYQFRRRDALEVCPDADKVVAGACAAQRELLISVIVEVAVAEFAARTRKA